MVICFFEKKKKSFFCQYFWLRVGLQFEHSVNQFNELWTFNVTNSKIYYYSFFRSTHILNTFHYSLFLFFFCFYAQIPKYTPFLSYLSLILFITVHYKIVCFYAQKLVCCGCLKPNRIKKKTKTHTNGTLTSYDQKLYIINDFTQPSIPCFILTVYSNLPIIIISIHFYFHFLLN